MYNTIKQRLTNLSKEEYLILKELSNYSKNMYNVALYNIRQNFFKGNIISYETNYHEFKLNENYSLLNSNMAQTIAKQAHSDFSSFMALLKLKGQGKYSAKVKIPNYKKTAYFELIIGQVRIDNGYLVLPISNLYRKTSKQQIKIKLPPVLAGKTVKRIRIIPKQDARFFEVQYSYEVSTPKRLKNNNSLACDLGINNLLTLATNHGETLIIDGKRLKSINQYANKRSAHFNSIKDKQKITTQTKRLQKLWIKRNDQVNDYIAKACRQAIKFAKDHEVSTFVLGYNPSFQKEVNLGKKNNQNFVNIPFGKIKHKLEYLCAMEGITFLVQEESYTSKASFFDDDLMPIYTPGVDITNTFSGKRIKRGLYKTSKGYIFNADVNGALNILTKSKAKDLTVLRIRGAVNSPKRINVWQ